MREGKRRRIADSPGQEHYSEVRGPRAPAMQRTRVGLRPRHIPVKCPQSFLPSLTFLAKETRCSLAASSPPPPPPLLLVSEEVKSWRVCLCPKRKKNPR